MAKAVNYVAQAARANLAGLKKEWAALKQSYKFAAPADKKKIAAQMAEMAQKLQTLSGQAKG